MRDGGTLNSTSYMLMRKIKTMFNNLRQKIFKKKRKEEIEHLSKSSIIDLHCSFDKNTFIEGYNVIGKNVNICSARIGLGSIIGHNSNLFMCNVGKFTSIGTNLSVITANHPLNFVSTHPCFYNTVNNYPLGKGKRVFDEFLKCSNGFAVNIGNDVWIGNNVLIKGGITVGNGAVIGMGSVVTKDVPPYAIVGGVPAKIIRYRFSESTIEKLQISEWWNWELKDILEKKDLFCDIDEFVSKLGKK